jgi:uncharacterized membrane protein
MVRNLARATRFHEQYRHLGNPFGSDRFGRLAEIFARTFGTPQFLIGQTAIVAVWVLYNSVRGDDFDPYPFILLNLAFSLQAAYAAPLILLAATRQAERDRAWSDADSQHREHLAANTLDLLDQNTQLTRQVAELTERINELTVEIHSRVVPDAGG